MEFVPGGEFFNYIRKTAGLQPDIARLYAAEILLALEHLHSKKIAHRVNFRYYRKMRIC
jgi:serine/threonine protein kinase